MNKALMMLVVAFGCASVFGSTHGDVERLARSLGTPCERCDVTTIVKRKDHRPDPAQEARALSQRAHETAADPYQARLNAIQDLSPAMKKRLDLLAQVHVLHDEPRLFLAGIHDMLTPLMAAYGGWEKERAKARPDHVFCHAVYDYFASALMHHLETHPRLEELGFVSAGLHPLLIPALEAFAQRGSGPGTMSFGCSHVCSCTKDASVRINTALRKMPFLSHVILEDESRLSSNIAPLILYALTKDTSVKALTLKGAPRHCCGPLVAGRDLFEGLSEGWTQGCVNALALTPRMCAVLGKSTVETLTLCAPMADHRLMASQDFAACLKTLHTLRTLVLRGEGYGYGNTKVFVDSVLGSASLTNVLFEGEWMHKSYGLRDCDREVIEAHLAQNRARGEIRAASSS